jgi:ribokinase
MVRICVVGSTNLDLTFQTPRLPRPGETLAGKTFTLGFGGKGANQAVTAARLGAAVTVVTRVGADVFGQQAVGNYRAHGIDTAYLRTDPGLPTGTAVILVDDAAQNCIVVVAGANGALSAEDVRAAASAVQSADAVLGQLEVPVEATREAFRLARAAGVRTVLNPAPAAPLPDVLLRLTDLCVPNETEVEALTGLSATTTAETVAAARVLLRRGPGAVLVTLGVRGALWVDGQTAEHFPAVAVQAVDPTGAGDAFIGSLAVFLAEGMGMRAAVRQANAVAALAVTRLGTQTAFPTRAEAEAFLAGPP